MKTNNTIALIRAGLLNAYALNKIKKTSGYQRMGLGLLFLLLAALVIPIFAILCLSFYGAGQVLLTMGRLDVLLVLSVLGSGASCLFVSIYKGSAYLFSFKDFDFLMSIPVKTSSVLASKFFLLYISNFLYSTVISLPPLVVYALYTGPSILYYVFVPVLIVCLPIIPMILGSMLSFVLARFSSHFKYANFVLILSSFALIIAIMFSSYYLDDLSSNEVEGIFGTLAGITSYYLPAGFFVDALAGTDFLSFLLFILAAIFVLVLFLFFFAKNFKTINAGMNEYFSAGNYKISALTASSPIQALCKKELRFYFSSYIYVINTAVGIIIFTVYIIALMLFDYETIAVLLDLPQAKDLIVPFTTAFAGGCAALSCTTACSISLEGNSLWILKSLPLDFGSIAKGKILANIAITLPLMFLNSILLAIAFQFSFLSYLAFMLPVMSYCFLSPCIGLLMNLRFPKLNWTSQVHAVKQSFSVVVSLLLNAFCLFIPIACYFLLQPGSYLLFAFGTSFIVFAMAWVLWIYIKTKGSQHFEKL